MEATISAANRQTADRTRRWLRITIAALVAVVIGAIVIGPRLYVLLFV